MCCPCSPFSIKSVPLSKCWLPQSDIFSRNQIQSWYFSPKLKGHLLSAAPCFNYQLEHVIHYFCHELTGYCLVFPSTTHVHTHMHTYYMSVWHAHLFLATFCFLQSLVITTDRPAHFCKALYKYSWNYLIVFLFTQSSSLSMIIYVYHIVVFSIFLATGVLQIAIPGF